MTADTARPEVSVLLAVHDGAAFLEDAVRSVMAQTLRDIEIVAVDDASTDESPDILARLAAEDPRLRVHRTPQNLRLAGALNYGLERARGRYVARMDDDDLSLPHRLEAQRDYLDAHPDVTLIGGGFRRIDAGGRPHDTVRRSLDTAMVRWMARFDLTLSHPTWMFRPELDGAALRYDPAFAYAQDHDFICRLLRAGGGVVALPDVVLDYRTHEGSVTAAKGRAQLDLAHRICTAHQAADLPPAVFEALAPQRDLYFERAPATPERIAGAFAGLRAMLDHDLARLPGRAAWLRRQSARLMAFTLQRNGVDKRARMRAFGRHAPGLAAALVLHRLEHKDVLPRRLHSNHLVRAGEPPAPISPEDRPR